MRRLQVAIASHTFAFTGGMPGCNADLVQALAEVADVHVIGVDVAPEVAAVARRTVLLSVPGTPNLVKGLSFQAQASRFLAGFEGLAIGTGATLWTSDLNVVHMCHRAWQELAHFSSLYSRVYTRTNAHLEKHAIQAARRVVAVSHQVKRDLVHWHGIEPERIHVVLNGVDTNRFHPRRDGEIPVLVAESGRLAILFVGDLGTPRKGLDTVFEAMRLAPDLDIELWVAGTGRRNPYPALARKLGLEDRVRFLGYRPDVEALFRAADAFVLPSRYDPFGMVGLEAMASGLPVVVSSRMGVSELITDGLDGYVVEDPHDPWALVSHWRRWLLDPAVRRRVGRAARQKALSHTTAVPAKAYRRIVMELAP